MPLPLPPRLSVDVGVAVEVDDRLAVVDVESLPESVGVTVDAGVPLSDPVLVNDDVAEELSVLVELGELLDEIVEVGVTLLEVVAESEPVNDCVGVDVPVDVDDTDAVTVVVDETDGVPLAEGVGVCALDGDGVCTLDDVAVIDRVGVRLGVGESVVDGETVELGVGESVVEDVNVELVVGESVLGGVSDGLVELLADRPAEIDEVADGVCVCVDDGVIVDVALSHGVAETDETAPGVTLAEAAATTHERKVTDPGGPFAPSTVDLPIALPVVYELTSSVFT